MKHTPKQKEFEQKTIVNALDSIDYFEIRYNFDNEIIEGHFGDGLFKRWFRITIESINDPEIKNTEV